MKNDLKVRFHEIMDAYDALKKNKFTSGGISDVLDKEFWHGRARFDKYKINTRDMEMCLKDINVNVANFINIVVKPDGDQAEIAHRLIKIANKYFV